MPTSRPSDREGFEVAIFCALSVEYDAVTLVFDKIWDDFGVDFGKQPGDPNNYVAGRIGAHNVILALLSHMGKASAASSVANTYRSFPNIRLAILAGICGGVPLGRNSSPSGNCHEMLLGDVVLSNLIVQHDFGSRYPDGFIRKESMRNAPGRPSKEIQNLLLTITTETTIGRLRRRVYELLGELQKSAADKKRQTTYAYPGVTEDRLFSASYRHMHHLSPTCICRQWCRASDPVCQDALGLNCHELGCDEKYLISRDRLDERRSDGDPIPVIHFGPIASGDTVMKSGVERDSIAKSEGVIAFEMEGAGICEDIPSVIIKGVCDYADSHKNKKWQPFAAATAACTVKAVLEQYELTKETTLGARYPEVNRVRQGGSNYASDVTGEEIIQGNELEISSGKVIDCVQDGSEFKGSVRAGSSVFQGNRVIL